MFDAASFLDQQITGSNDTKTIPIPEGDYLAIVEKIEAKNWTSKKDPSQSGVSLNVVWSIEDSAVKELLGRNKVTCVQSVMLDLNESGGLDMGKGRNIGLGRLREATGLNDPGRPFAFSQFPGMSARVSVKHRLHEDTIYSEVKAVAKI